MSFSYPSPIEFESELGDSNTSLDDFFSPQKPEKSKEKTKLSKRSNEKAPRAPTSSRGGGRTSRPGVFVPPTLDDFNNSASSLTLPPSQRDTRKPSSARNLCPPSPARRSRSEEVFEPDFNNSSSSLNLNTSNHGKSQANRVPPSPGGRRGSRSRSDEIFEPGNDLNNSASSFSSLNLPDKKTNSGHRVPASPGRRRGSNDVFEPPDFLHPNLPVVGQKDQKPSSERKLMNTSGHRIPQSPGRRASNEVFEPPNVLSLKPPLVDQTSQKPSSERNLMNTSGHRVPQSPGGRRASNDSYVPPPDFNDSASSFSSLNLPEELPPSSSKKEKSNRNLQGQKNIPANPTPQKTAVPASPTPKKTARFVTPQSPGNQRGPPGRSKSNDDSFFGNVQRPALPKSKSGRFLPMPVPSRLPKGGQGAGKPKKMLARKAPAFTQSAGSLDHMQSGLIKKAKDKSDKSRAPVSPESNDILLTPSKQKKSLKNFLSSPLSRSSHGLMSSSDHGPSPVPSCSRMGKKEPSLRNFLGPGKSKNSDGSQAMDSSGHKSIQSAPADGPVNRRAHTKGRRRSGHAAEGPDSPPDGSHKKDKPKSFKQLLKKAPGNTPMDNAGAPATRRGRTKQPTTERERSMSPLKRDSSPEPEREPSLSPEEVQKKPASGLLTGFLDTLYDSFIKEEDDDDSDDGWGDMNASVSRLDASINKLAGLA